MSLAENYHLETGRHLNVYGDISELFGAIVCGIKLNKSYAQGADGRLGNDQVEIKTVTPFKSKDEVFVKVFGNFSELLVVKTNADVGIIPDGLQAASQDETQSFFSSGHSRFREPGK